MKQELDRVKNDLQTVQSAMGFSPGMGQDWAPWMKRDLWLCLLWCVPGVILIASAWLEPHSAARYFGLNCSQWSGVLVAAVLFGVLHLHIRKTLANDGRPESLVREYRRLWGLDTYGKWSGVAFTAGLLLYVLWAWKFRIGARAFVPGFCILFGSVYLVIAVFARLWMLLGVAVPVLAYGLFGVLFSTKGVNSGLPLGLTVVGMAVSSYLIQHWQIRQLERENESH